MGRGGSVRERGKRRHGGGEELSGVREEDEAVGWFAEADETT